MPYKDPEKKRAYYQSYEQKARGRIYRQKRRLKNNVYSVGYHHALVAEARRRLGNKCACPGCEVSEPTFLTIDHIYGRSKGRKKDAREEAKASGWDNTKFQILCANCNFAKRNRGFCPVHQTEPNQQNGHNPEANLQLAFIID